MRALLVAVACALLLAGCGLQDPYSAAKPAATQVVQAQQAGGVSARPVGPAPAARSFLHGYLPYLYGLGAARAIASATPQLRRALAAQPMSRDDGASPSHPRVEALRVLAEQRATARVRAVVSDESGVYYAIDLALARDRRGWRVAAVRMGGS